MNTAIDAATALNQSKNSQASISAHDLENLIEMWRAVLVHEPDREKKRYAEARMRELIAQRSKQTVERMERERGLR